MSGSSVTSDEGNDGRGLRRNDGRPTTVFRTASQARIYKGTLSGTLTEAQEQRFKGDKKY